MSYMNLHNMDVNKKKFSPPWDTSDPPLDIL